jgi:hypothetical protein
MAASKKTVAPPTAIETPVTDEAPKVEAAVYDPDNLGDVLERLRSLVTELRELSGDLAGHHRMHSSVRLHGLGGLIVPAQYDPPAMARIHSLQMAMGEFVNATQGRL